MTGSEVVEALTRFAEVIGNIEKEWLAAEDGIADADRELQDLLHRLEFDSFNAAEGYHLAKKVQAARIRRRELKNKQEVLKPLRDFSDKQKLLREAVLQTALRIQGVQQTQAARCYSLKTKEGVVR
jgi:hypothetical protein